MPILRVALDLPLHRLFDYLVAEATPADVGLRVRVPFGRGERIGIIVEVQAESDWPVEQLKPANAILRDLPPLPADFLRLCDFASSYYQAPLGEVLLQALPAGLKRLDPPARRSGRKNQARGARAGARTDRRAGPCRGGDERCRRFRPFPGARGDR